MDYDRKYMSRADADVAHYDVGLRQYMLGVYNHMVAALAFTGVIAYATTLLAVQDGVLTGFGQAIYGSPLKWVVMLAPLGMVLLLSARISSMSLGGARVAFYVYAALMGLSLSSILLVFTGESVARVFFITAAAFGGLSLYGYTTKKDLWAGCGLGWLRPTWCGPAGPGDRSPALPRSGPASAWANWSQSPAAPTAVPCSGWTVLAASTAAS